MLRLNFNKSFIGSAVILGRLIIGALYVLAQAGSIAGKITDSAGNVVSGAEIKAVISSPDGAATPRIFRAYSGFKGEFTISGLPFGSYEIEVTAPMFKTLKKNIVVDGSQPTRIDLQITSPKVCEDAKGPNIELSEKDKEVIINQALKMLIQSWQAVREPILLSTQNIKAAWVKAPQGRTITALSTSEIIGKARPGELIFYWYFSKFDIHGDCVAINLIESGVTSEGEECNLCGRGATYVFRKEAGEWKGKFFSGWIS